MHRFLILPVQILLVLIATRTAAAHGGGHGVPYNGPSGTVPPNIRSGTPQPTGPTGPTGPTSRPDPPPTTTTPTPPPLPSGTPSGASSASRSGTVSGAASGFTRNPNSRSRGSFEDWEFWWSFNKERYLNLKKHLYRHRAVVSESGDYFLGRRTGSEVVDTARPTKEYVRTVLIPGLLDMLKASHADIRDSACIALGKVGNAAEVDILCRMLEDNVPGVRKAAVVGLGLLRTARAIKPLLAILEAGPPGRSLRGGRTPESDLRAMAATGLGLTGDNDFGDVKEALMRYSRSIDVHKTIRVNATVALGLMRGNRAYVEGITGHLKILVASPRFDDFVRAHAVVSLARLLDRNAVAVDRDTLRFLHRLVRRERAGHVHRSAVIALGLLVKDPQDHADSLKLLQHELMRGRNNTSRNFAAIALGQTGIPAAFRPLQKVVLKAKGQHGAYAALGLGILCDGFRGNAEHLELRLKGLNALVAGFRRVKNPQIMSGYAIALGIARHSEAGKDLLEAMKKNRGTTLKGYLAVALGIANYTPAVEYLRTVLDNTDNLPLLKQQTAIGLGLMGNRDVAANLVRSLKEDSSTFVQASITQALGYIGDRTSILPLTTMLTDSKARNLTRAFACVALGTIGEDTLVPVLSELFVHHNFPATNRTLMELHRIM